MTKVLFSDAASVTYVRSSNKKKIFQHCLVLVEKILKNYQL